MTTRNIISVAFKSALTGACLMAISSYGHNMYYRGKSDAYKDVAAVIDKILKSSSN